MTDRAGRECRPVLYLARPTCNTACDTAALSCLAVLALRKALGFLPSAGPVRRTACWGLALAQPRERERERVRAGSSPPRHRDQRSLGSASTDTTPTRGARGCILRRARWRGPRTRARCGDKTPPRCGSGRGRAGTPRPIANTCPRQASRSPGRCESSRGCQRASRSEGDGTGVGAAAGPGRCPLECGVGEEQGGQGDTRAASGRGKGDEASHLTMTAISSSGTSGDTKMKGHRVTPATG